MHSKYTLFAPNIKETIKMVTDSIKRGYIIDSVKKLSNSFCVTMKGYNV